MQDIFRALDEIDTGAIGVLITEAQLERPGPKILYVNKSWSKLMQYTLEEVVGHSPRMFQGPKTNRDVLTQLKLRLSQGHTFNGFTVNYKKDRTEVCVVWSIFPANIKGVGVYFSLVRETGVEVYNKLLQSPDLSIFTTSFFPEHGVFEPPVCCNGSEVAL